MSSFQLATEEIGRIHAGRFGSVMSGTDPRIRTKTLRNQNTDYRYHGNRQGKIQINLNRRGLRTIPTYHVSLLSIPQTSCYHLPLRRYRYRTVRYLYTTVSDPHCLLTKPKFGYILPQYVFRNGLMRILVMICSTKYSIS